MGGMNKWKTGSAQYGGTVLWEAARLEWKLWAVLIAALFIYTILAGTPSSRASAEPPVAQSCAGGSFSFEATGELLESE